MGQLNISRLIDDLGGPARVAEMVGVQRTAPYGWVKRGYVGSPVLEAIKAAKPNIDIDDYFEPDKGSPIVRRTKNGKTVKGRNSRGVS